MNNSEKSVSILRDFPDWLSPMVVKEVRQGLRGWVFVGAFLLLHLCLLFWVYLTLVTANSFDDNDAFFWLTLIGGLVVIVLRGLVGVATEREENTLELLQLSRLTAFRIITGKWVALMAQIVVFLASLLPYGVLRYYTGALNVDLDGKIFLLITSLAAIFSVLSVYLSCVTKWISIPALLGALWFVVLMKSEAGNIDRWPWLFIGGVAGLAVIYIPFFLLLGASTFASASENLATPKRILGWLVMVPAVVCLVIGMRMLGGAWVATFVLLLSSPLLLLVMADALTAPSATTPFALRGFHRRGKIGHFAAAFLAPNRAAGFLYTVSVGVMAIAVASALCLGLADTHFSLADLLRIWISFIFAAGAIVYLAGSVSALLTRRRSRFIVYFFWGLIVFQILVGFFLIYMATDFSDRSTRPFWQVASLVSPMGFFAAMTDDLYHNFPLKNRDNLVLVIVAGVAQWMLVLILYSFTLLREGRLLKKLLHHERTEERA